VYAANRTPLVKNVEIIKTLLKVKLLEPYRILTTKFTLSIMQYLKLSHTIGMNKFDFKKILMLAELTSDLFLSI